MKTRIILSLLLICMAVTIGTISASATNEPSTSENLNPANTLVGIYAFDEKGNTIDVFSGCLGGGQGMSTTNGTIGYSLTTGVTYTMCVNTSQGAGTATFTATGVRMFVNITIHNNGQACACTQS